MILLKTYAQIIEILLFKRSLKNDIHYNTNSLFV
jgi:hypothetical protein